MALSLLLLFMGKLCTSRWMLWLIFLATPFPYIATTAGWTTAETGRQPFLAYDILRTVEGSSPLVNEGNSLFTLLGFSGLYLLMGLLYLLLILNVLRIGPRSASDSAPIVEIFATEPEAI